MKKLLTIVLAVIMFGCSKNFEPTPKVQTDIVPQFTKPDYLELPAGASRRSPGRGPKQRNVILVDFDGGVCANSAWNWNGPIPYGPSGLTEAQHDEIISKLVRWFDTLNVRITTDEKVFERANANHRQRILVTATWEWYGQVGGVAFVNSFGSGTPCWVFSSLLGNNTHYISAAAAHEAGHTLNLYHQALYNEDCIMLNNYRPHVMMGVGYYVQDPPWITGPTSEGCYDIQNDLQIMSRIVGYK